MRDRLLTSEVCFMVAVKTRVGGRRVSAALDVVPPWKVMVICGGTGLDSFALYTAHTAARCAILRLIIHS